jgi:hypothetical protein
MDRRKPDSQIFGLSARAALEYTAILAFVGAIIYRAATLIMWDKFGPPN